MTQPPKKVQEFYQQVAEMVAASLMTQGIQVAVTGVALVDDLESIASGRAQTQEGRHFLFQIQTNTVKVWEMQEDSGDK